MVVTSGYEEPASVEDLVNEVPFVTVVDSAKVATAPARTEFRIRSLLLFQSDDAWNRSLRLLPFQKLKPSTSVPASTDHNRFTIGGSLPIADTAGYLFNRSSWIVF